MRNTYLLIFSLSFPLWLAAQSSCKLRTDGIYLFDNGIDTVMYNDFVSIDSSAMQFQVFTQLGNEISPYGAGDVHPIVDGRSTFLSALLFDSNNTGYSINLGIFRDVALLKRLATFAMNNSNVLSNWPSVSPIVDFEELETGMCIFSCQRNAFFGIEEFRLVSCESNLHFEYMRKIEYKNKQVTSVYNSERHYKFISFIDILSEDFTFPRIQ